MRNQWTQTGLKISALTLALTMAAGCGVELEGDEGNLSFNYADSEWVATAAGGDLAKGASVDVYVTELDANGEALELVEAFSDDAQSIEVTDERSHDFQLTAHEQSPAEGTSINATALDGDGEELSDSTSIVASEVDSVEFDTLCSEATYVTDSNALFQYRMKDSLDDSLTGYGHYPVDVEPADGGTVNDDHRVLQTLEVATGDEPGSYELVATDDVDADAMDFDLVEPGDIDELDIRSSHEDSKDVIEVGETDFATLFKMGTTDFDDVCGGAEGAIDIDNSTPDVCEARYHYVGQLNMHSVEVEGLEAGSCDFDLSVVDTELSESISVEIE